MSYCGSCGNIAIVPKSRTGRVWLWVLLGLIPVIYLLLLNSNLSPFVDNARYIAAAQSLLSGQGYSRIHTQSIGPQTLYPPGYPLLLAGLIYLFSLNILAFKLVSVLATVGALVGLYFLLKRQVVMATAATLTLLAGVNPLLAFFATVELTEAPYLLLSVLALLFIERSTDQDRSRLYLPVAIVISAGAYYFKSAGLALLPGALFYFAYKKEYKKMLVFALGFAALIAPWIIRSLTVEAAYNGTYFKQLMWKDPYNIGLGKANLVDFAGRAGLNFIKYSTLGLFPLKENFSLGRGLAWPATVLALSFSSLVVAGFFRKIKENVSAIEAYVFSYFGMQLLWPMVDIRFIHPILPFVLYYFLIGARGVGHRLGEHLSKPLLAQKVVSALVVALIIISLSTDLRMIITNKNKGGLELEQAHFYEAIGWLKDHSAEKSYILSVRPEVVFVLSDRKAESYQRSYLTSSKDHYDHILKKDFDYIVIDAFDNTNEARRLLVQAIVTHPQEFRSVYSSPENKVEIYQVEKP